MIFKTTFRLYWLLALATFISAGFLSVLAVAFFKQHISLAELLLAEGVAAALVAGYICVRRTFYARRDMQLGFLLIGAGLAALLLPFTKPIFYLYTILRGAGTIIFFTPYNILHFQNPVKEKLLQGMTRYFGVMIIAGFFGPVLGAALLERSGLLSFLCVALFLVLCGVYLARLIPEQAFVYTSRALVGHLRRMRTITAVDGALQKVLNVVTIYALVYIHTTSDYGNFLALISLVALVGALHLAKHSDRKLKRMVYIWPLSISAGIITILFAIAHTVTFFIILTLLLKAISVLVEPLRSNIIQDTIPPSPINWISRELYLNVGRAVLYGTIFLLLKFNLGPAVFISLGLLHFLFPFLVRYKKIYAA